MTKRKLPGFTIAEILVVIAILAILIASLIPIIQTARKAARGELMSPSERLVYHAEQICGNPNRWNTNAQSLIEFTKAAKDAGVSDTESVNNFKLAAIELIAFATGWVNRLDEGEREELGVKLKASIDPTSPAELQHSQDYANLLNRTTDKLSETETEEFAEIYVRIVDAFDDIYSLATEIDEHPSE